MMEADRDDAASTPQRVGVREYRGNMTGFLRQAHNGKSFLVTSHDEVLAEIRPPSTAVRPTRQPSALRGNIRLMGDFDESPADVLAALEGGAG